MVPERKIRHRCIQTLGGASGETSNGFISTLPCSWAQVGIIRDLSFCSKFILFQQWGPLTPISALVRNITLTLADPPCLCWVFFQLDIVIPLAKKKLLEIKKKIDFSFWKLKPVQRLSRLLPHLRISITQLQMFEWIQECDLCPVSGEPLLK